MTKKAKWTNNDIKCVIEEAFAKTPARRAAITLNNMGISEADFADFANTRIARDIPYHWVLGVMNALRDIERCP